MKKLIKVIGDQEVAFANASRILSLTISNGGCPPGVAFVKIECDKHGPYCGYIIDDEDTREFIGAWFVNEDERLGTLILYLRPLNQLKVHIENKEKNFKEEI